MNDMVTTEDQNTQSLGKSRELAILIGI